MAKANNVVVLIGRLTSDPRISGEGDKKVARFNLAVDRGKDKNGNDLTDFPSVVAWGPQADFAQKWLKKGTGISIIGRIMTGKYTNKEGQTVYTTDVAVDSYTFLPSNKSGDEVSQAPQPQNAPQDDFQGLDEAVPF